MGMIYTPEQWVCRVGTPVGSGAVWIVEGKHVNATELAVVLSLLTSMSTDGAQIRGFSFCVNPIPIDPYL
jgi:hypothetical protein